MKFAADFFDDIAVRILSAHEAALPDLRNVIVLLPNLHVAQPLAAALMRRAKQTVLLLPQMVTLNEWAQGVRIEAPVVENSQRSALLYSLLRDKKWFEQADLWGMTRELLELFDELTNSLKVLSENESEFADAVQRAYAARQNSTLQLEARLVFELWHAMQSGEELDNAQVYLQRLTKLAARARQPLFVLLTSDLNSQENRFLDQYALNAKVTICDLREMQQCFLGVVAHALNATQSPGEKHSNYAPLALLEELGGSEKSLVQLSAVLGAQNIISLSGSLSFFGATSLEQEACAAAMQVRIWLQQGKRNIAIVAQDRVVARRMRALLERAEVLVTDESGWTMATLSVSTVLDRWLTALQSDFYHHDLLDLLKSPFIFDDMAPTERKAAVYQLEQLLRKQGVVTGLEKFITLTLQNVELHRPLARLRQAAELFGPGKKKSLSEWLVVLRESLQILGIEASLQHDEAGVQLLQSLQERQQELQEDSGRYRFNEWRRWLAQQLDTQTYRDRCIDSPVRFTHLAATRWRAFDAVLLLGCDAEHLPSVADGGRWFNDAVRGSLKLPTRTTNTARQRDDLLALLALNDCVLVTWQKDRNGEPGLLSPYLEILRDLHKLTYADDLSEHELQALLVKEKTREVDLAGAAKPSPSVAPNRVPVSVSISAYNSLVACPYQFYARYILRLNELDEVREGIEKRDYGERVHEILRRFHERYVQASEHPVNQLKADLRQISEDVFEDLVQQDFAARAWLARWLATLPVYIEWQLKNEAQGWRYAESESAFDWELEGVRLRGRIDRLDVRGEEKRVLDYKTQSDPVLRNKLREPGEDVQLACYAYAHEAADAAFVSIENGKVKLVEPKQDMPQLAQLNTERLVEVMANIRGGSGLPANGIDAACEYCEMRGVCRKGEWR